MYQRLMTSTALAGILLGGHSAVAAEPSVADYQKTIRPLLEQYCYDCHGDGETRGGVALDSFQTKTNFTDSHDICWRMLKNLRANLMPPASRKQPSKAEKDLIVAWIKKDVFEVDPAAPDPGRVTIRRLNRVEYHNTVRDLLGVDYDTGGEFPPEDTGHGFDNIGDVLTISPMLLEKYMVAAEKIINETVPVSDGVAPEHHIDGRQFSASGDRGYGPLWLSYYTPAAVTNTFNAQYSGEYQLKIDLVVNEQYVDGVFDYNKCRLIFHCDGKELLNEEFSWQDGKPYHFSYDQTWTAGDHQLDFMLEPVSPGSEHTRSLSMQVKGVTVRGPMAAEHQVKPKNYAKFFPKPIPTDAADKRQYARELLGDFAYRAFRRPVDNDTKERLADLAEKTYSQAGRTFESGIAEGMTAILASPRFIFRQESVAPNTTGDRYPMVDEYALASRLSYFLWTSMPDDELLSQAAAGTLRKNLSQEVTRMLADKKASALEENFVGQWLQARDIETVPIEARSVLAREKKYDPETEIQRKRFFALNARPEDQLSPAEKAELVNLRQVLFRNPKAPPRADLTWQVRDAMRRETDDTFKYILDGDRSLLELLNSDYTFLNEPLAKHYGITNVVGNEMRLVQLPPDSPRGGVLTEGTVLAVTSNPTRTSPVKRGVFILDNILGIPPLPPPPNIPPLEEATKNMTNKAPTLRETLAVHRKNPLCASCHNQMDPLGLALENFNAMGMWRSQEFDQPIDASGKLVTGETFTNIQELKQVLVTHHAEDFYRTVTQKMLTYALGRGLDYYDVETVDEIVARIEQAGGRSSALIAGIIESAPFQKTRVNAPVASKSDARPVESTAAAAKPGNAL